MVAMDMAHDNAFVKKKSAPARLSRGAFVGYGIGLTAVPSSIVASAPAISVAATVGDGTVVVPVACAAVTPVTPVSVVSTVGDYGAIVIPVVIPIVVDPVATVALVAPVVLVTTVVIAVTVAVSKDGENSPVAPVVNSTEASCSADPNAIIDVIPMAWDADSAVISSSH
ncbi:MAG: hypothetical protein ACI97A_000215 [Planctomycetota bacterium]|jgi:hypothetical protein